MKDNSETNGKFFSGFVIGLLVGAFVVFLLGTKKGKKLLKAISEEGVGNISDIIENANKSVDLDESVERQEENYSQKRKFAAEERFAEDAPKARRFFRGISRRVN